MFLIKDEWKPESYEDILKDLMSLYHIIDSTHKECDTCRSLQKTARKEARLQMIAYAFGNLANS